MPSLAHLGRVALTRRAAVVLVAALMGAAAQAALDSAGPAGSADSADSADHANWDLRGQATYIWQHKPAFAAAYSGPHSLAAPRALSYSFTATAALGLRLADGLEAYANAELVQGVPFSGLTGMGGLSNGELQKSAGSNPIVYRARLFVRRTWALGDLDAGEDLVADFNRLPGRLPTDRLVLVAGNLAVTDIFDLNPYAHDARSQFMNWALLTHGSWDFAADARGYTWGAALEWVQGDWSLRAGRFAMPVESNGLKLDGQISRQYGDQVEAEHRHRAFGHEGTLRTLLWRNVARYGSFSDALATAGATAPSLDGVRRRQAKTGWGVGLEQGLTPSLRAFARIGASDGAREAYTFAAIDRSASVGLALSGQAWSRPKDSLGLAVARNQLSAVHQRFLAAGGVDFFLGDGRLRYAPETVLEAFVAVAVADGMTVSLDLQHVQRPGYNADRGPARFVGLRLHAEF